MRLIHIPLILLLLTLIPLASADTQYIEGYSLDGLSKVTPSSAEQSLGVLHKYTNDDVIIYIAEDGIRFTAITDTGNAWVQYDFNNPNSVQPTINASEKSATWPSIYNNVDIKYTLIPSGLKQELVVYDTPPSDVFRETISISEGLTLEKINGEWLFSKDGVRVFSLQKPYAVDANGTEYNLDLTKRIEGSSLYLEIDASTALEKCVYPLTIDPTTYSGGYLSFWGSDVYDLPSLYTVTANSSLISYDAPTTTYTFHVPVYQNDSSHFMSMDNATILLQSNNDGSPVYIRWAGQCDFSDLHVFGWDTVAEEYSPITDTTRAYVNNDVGATCNITNCNMSYLGYGGSSITYGIVIKSTSNVNIDNLSTITNYFGLELSSVNNSIISNSNVSGKVGIYPYMCTNITILNCNGYSDTTSGALYLRYSTNCNIINSTGTGIGTNGYGIYLYDADNNTFTNCTGNSSSSYGIYVYSGSTGNEFNYCDGISGTSQALYVYSSSTGNYLFHCNGTATGSCAYITASNNTLENCNFTSVNGYGTIFTTALNTNVINHRTHSSSLQDYYFNGLSTVTVTNPLDDVFTVGMNEVDSQLTIRNTDGQLFNETATATAYSHSNGSFEMYETGTAETFTITQYDSFLDSTTANSTVVGVPHTYSSINITSGTIDSWISSGLTPSAYYELLTGGTTIDFIYADVDGNVTVTDDLAVGEYYLTPAVTYNVSGYVFNDDTPANPIEGATVNRAGVQSTTTNATGYYILAVYNSTSTFTANANGYNYNQTDITVDGAPLTDQNFTLTAEQPNYVPLPIYLLTSIVTLGGLFLTIPRRDSESGQFNTSAKHIMSGLLAGGLSFVLAKVSINSQLVQTFAGVTSADTIAIDHSIIQIAWLGWFWTLIGVVSFIFAFYCILMMLKDYAEQDLYQDIGDDFF